MKWKNEKWKQPGPGMQLTAILSSLSGIKHIFDVNIISKDIFDEKFFDHIEDLLKISKRLHHLTWEDCEKDELLL